MTIAPGSRIGGYEVTGKLVEGPTLAERLEAGPLSLEEEARLRAACPP